MSTNGRAPYKNNEIRFCAFLMCHKVPFLGHEPDPSGKEHYCNFLFDLDTTRANEFWMAFQNSNAEYKVDAKQYAYEYESLKAMRHRLPRSHRH